MSDLWAGVDLKLNNARFHLDGMGKALQPPDPRPQNIALYASSGAFVLNDWHLAFYAHLDAFLSAARSVPEIIRCCFGVDRANRTMADWFNALDQNERVRRKRFGTRFKADYDGFRALPLGTARHISEHRTGVTPVTVTISGRFGVTYVGNPTTRVPTTETRRSPDDYSWQSMAQPTPVQPTWNDFDINGQPLFETCRAYVDSARTLIERARALTQEVHGDSTVTPPPSEM